MIGLGSMGFGMAKSLRRNGFNVRGFDVAPAFVESFAAEGGEGVASPAEAADGANVIVCVVVNAAQTEAVLFGPDGISGVAKNEAVFISSATMDPAAAQRLGEKFEATGRHYLDAPISGGAARAAKGNLRSWLPACPSPSPRQEPR